MRWLLAGVVTTVFTLLAAGLAGACDGCGKGGHTAPAAPPPGAPMPPVLPAAPPQMLPAMPPPAMPPAMGVPEAAAPCPCHEGRRGMRGIPPAGRCGEVPCNGGACPCPQATGMPTGLGPNAALEANRYWSSAAGCHLYFDPATRVSYFWSESPRGYFPVPPQFAAPEYGGPAAPAPSAVDGRATLYYAPDARVPLATYPAGRLR